MVKDTLNELVDSVALTHEQVTIAKNGSPVATLIGTDEWDAVRVAWAKSCRRNSRVRSVRDAGATGSSTKSMTRTCPCLRRAIERLFAVWLCPSIPMNTYFLGHIDRV